ncbi:MAG: hypothetical protein J6S40_03790 [Thermoguttaceae bacterium]|nr:hypothetical protein [Thermoguttaceae bacterium]
MSYTQENGEPLRPFPLKHFSRGCSSDSLREEAARITESARAEIDRYREETEARLRRKEEELALLSDRLDRKAAELDRRQRNLGKENSDEGWDQGYRDGLAAGREDGYAEGKENAEAEWQSEFETIQEEKLRAWSETNLPTLRELVKGLSGARGTLIEFWEKNILQVAAGIAHQTVARELPKMKDLPISLLREALELTIGCTSIKVRMNPDDLNRLRAPAEALLKEFSQITSAELIADVRIQPGGCEVETSLGVVDLQLESRLKRIVEELSR